MISRWELLALTVFPLACGHRTPQPAPSSPPASSSIDAGAATIVTPRKKTDADEVLGPAPHACAEDEARDVVCGTTWGDTCTGIDRDRNFSRAEWTGSYLPEARRHGDSRFLPLHPEDAARQLGAMESFTFDAPRTRHYRTQGTGAVRLTSIESRYVPPETPPNTLVPLRCCFSRCSRFGSSTCENGPLPAGYEWSASACFVFEDAKCPASWVAPTGRTYGLVPGFSRETCCYGGPKELLPGAHADVPPPLRRVR